MNTKQIFYYTLAVLIVFSSCKDKPERAVEGKVKRETISFTPKVTGRILDIYVQEGQLVHKGDTLAMLDVPEVSAKIAQAKGVVQAATAQSNLARAGASPNQLKQLEAKYDAAKEQFNYAEKSYKRADAMFKDSMMSAQNHDEVFAKYRAAKAQLDAVTAELNEVKGGTRSEKQEAARGQQAQASGALQEAEVAYSERFIIATNDMEIETISLNVGELATAGYALFNGYIPSSTYIRFTIPEGDIGKYNKGQTLSIYIPYAKDSLQGKVLTIKQMARYASITAAYPDYQLEQAIYEIKVQPDNVTNAEKLLVNSTAILQK